MSALCCMQPNKKAKVSVVEPEQLANSNAAQASLNAEDKAEIRKLQRRGVDMSSPSLVSRESSGLQLEKMSHAQGVNGNNSNVVPGSKFQKFIFKSSKFRNIFV